jgi:phosphoglycerate dehydrogenase-like enzyme
MRPLIIGAGNIGTQVIKMLAQIGFSTQKDSSMYCVDS